MPEEKVSPVMFYKQFLAYAVHIDWCIILSINIQVARSQLALRYMMTSGMHRHPFKVRYPVFLSYLFSFFKITKLAVKTLIALRIYSVIYSYGRILVWYLKSFNIAVIKIIYSRII